MAIRTFLFCDICNIQGIRYVEQRRRVPRKDDAGQRLTDGRSWFEGDVEVAVAEHGWTVTATNKHVCPNCTERLKRHPDLEVS